MTRFFLTLLALLTGLVAQDSPAQARVGGLSQTEIGAVHTAGAVANVSARGHSVAAPAPRGERVPGVQPLPRRPGNPVFVPSVQLGVDRARE